MTFFTAGMKVRICGEDSAFYGEYGVIRDKRGEGETLELLVNMPAMDLTYWFHRIEIEPVIMVELSLSAPPPAATPADGGAGATLGDLAWRIEDVLLNSPQTDTIEDDWRNYRARVATLEAQLADAREALDALRRERDAVVGALDLARALFRGIDSKAKWALRHVTAGTHQSQMPESLATLHGIWLTANNADYDIDRKLQAATLPADQQAAEGG